MTNHLKYNQLTYEKINRNAVIVDDAFMLHSDGRVIGRTIKRHKYGSMITYNRGEYSVSRLMLWAFYPLNPMRRTVIFHDGDIYNCALKNIDWLIPKLRL